MKTLDFIKLDEKKSAKVAEALKQLLADFQVYYTNLRGFHWNIKGHEFFVLHEKFEELYNGAAETVDEIAERILQLGEEPENRFSEYLKNAKVREIAGVACPEAATDNVLETMSLLIEQERAIVEIAGEAGDEVTVAMMDDLLVEQEKMVWMLVAFKSGRK